MGNQVVLLSLLHFLVVVVVQVHEGVWVEGCRHLQEGGEERRLRKGGEV